MNRDRQQIIAKFDKCPSCGSTRRLAGDVADEEREKGRMDPELRYGLYEMGGPIVDPRKANEMLVGSMVPVVRAVVDVCLDCGMVYTITLERGEVPLQAVAMKPGQRPPGFMPPQRG
ncbi:MAG: hypothetical protein ACOC58_00135 [Chloroflexota bacterium]